MIIQQEVAIKKRNFFVHNIILIKKADINLNEQQSHRIDTDTFTYCNYGTLSK